ncbi:MAG: FAD-dependent oxidoreductase [Deltaproteobacteria bacterium]|nr:FAD-dependent oxidoreductase [Deltaproteobacteria bacterium]
MGDAPDIVVIGGGPAGSTAAAMAAKAGLDVLLLEAGAHPRVHVGESLLPGIIPILEDIGALDAIEAAGFGPKTGSTHRNWGRTPHWDLWFRDSDAFDQAWLVERDRFDAILFEAATRAGARAHQHAAVTALHWTDDHLTGLTWQPRGQPPRTVHPRLVIDASGSRALIAEARDLREPIEGFQHEALWAHWEHTGRLPEPRQHQALFAAEPDHWLWMFPMPDGRASVGVVRLHQPEPHGTSRDYDAAVAASPTMSEVLGPNAKRVTAVRRERDWSYRVRQVAGPGWMAVGDAAGFIDPVLSTGVHLAMHSAWHAATTATALLRDDDPEALTHYASHHRELFEDLLRMVRFYYQQNVHVDDYFWESKRILMRRELTPRPDKAFVILTSGLVQNLALRARDADDDARRRGRSLDATSPSIDDGADPDQLDFVCIHLRHHSERDEHSALYVLIEPRDPARRALARTPNWQVNAIAPRHGSDPVSVPALGPTIRGLTALVERLDTEPSEPLAAFWRRTRVTLVAQVRALAPAFTLVRVFGE